MSAPWRLNLPRPRRALGTVAVIVATIVTGAGPLIPGGTPAASADDPRLAEMASPSSTRGLIYTGLTLGKDGSACDGAFEAKSRTGASLGCSHGPDPAPPGVDVRQGRNDTQLAADIAAGLARAAATAGTRTDGGDTVGDDGSTAGEAGGPSSEGMAVSKATAASEATADGEATAASEGGSATAYSGSIGCIGDGVSGARVQAIYAVASDRTERSATVIQAIRANYAPRIDWQFNQSAAETGGEAHPTFVTEPGAGGNGCQLSVVVAHLTASGDDSFSNTISELKAQGYNRKDRKYLVWADANVLCGVASVYSDTRPGLNNMNNGGATMFARVDAGCWGHAEGHELMHTLGSVQEGAPHATANGHCYDEPDDMCYDDDGNGPATMVTVCTGRSGALFDCNHDDYFYAGTPPLVSWLSTHWNTYNSNWLLRGPLPDVATVPPPGTSSPTPTPSTTTTTRPPVLPLPTRPPTVSPPPNPPVTPSPARQASGYWMLTADGHVHAFGGATFLGQPYPLPRGVRAVDLEPTPSGFGYWVVDDTGRVRSYGDADRYGSVTAGELGSGERAVSLSATPSGEGYWVFTDRGQALPFGDADFFGDMSGADLNQPVIGSVATPSGQGYFMFAADGGIFTFGDAAFHGSTGALRLNKPVVAMAVSPSRGGYSLVAADGGLFAFGDARFYGSLGATRLNRPVSAVVPGQAGYLMVGEDGGAFSFGDVSFFGSLGANPPPAPVVSVALRS